ncbi:MAG TPA: VOC family protein [Acidimicrobiales bacterium]
MTEVIFERVAPIITVNDLATALARYRRLGFATELDESAHYGFVERGMVQLHLLPDDPDDPGGTGGLVYLYVSDADAVHAEWTSAGVEGRFIGPHDTPYGLREFIYTDPDGIVHKVGSPL